MKALLICHLVFLLPPFANAGHETNNGGGGVVCRQGEEIIWIDLYDFWEAESLRHMAIVKSHAPLKQQLQSAQQRLGAKMDNQTFLHRVLTKLSKILAVKTRFHSEWGITLPADMQNRFYKKGCNLEGIASFDDTSHRLDVDEELFRHLSLTSQAGLYMHEAIYWVLRRYYGQTDSKQSRFITACAFSQDPCPELKMKTPRNKSCKAGSKFYQHEFAVAFTSRKHLKLTFHKIAGHAQLINHELTLEEFGPCFNNSESLFCQQTQGRYAANAHTSEDRFRSVADKRKFEFLTDKKGKLFLNGNDIVCTP